MVTKTEEQITYECGRCDRDGFKRGELNYIDPTDKWGFCDECWKIIQVTGRVD